MKNVFTKLLTVLMVLSLLLSLGLAAGATELVSPFSEKDLEEALKNAAPVQEGLDSLQKASGGEGAMGIFALQLQKGDINVHLSAFLVEQSGSVYLVTDKVYGSYLMDSASTLTLKTSSNGGYSQKATCLGEDGMFVYLSASGLDAFMPLTAGTRVMKQGQLYVEQVNDGKVGKGLGYRTLDLEAMDNYKNADNEKEYVFFNMGGSIYNLEIGAPVLESGTSTVFAIGSFATHPEDGESYPVYWTFASTVLSEEYALNGSGGGGGNGGGSDPTEGGNGGGSDPTEGGNSGGSDPTEGGNSGGNTEGGNGGGSDDGEEKSGFEFKPIYLLYIAIVAVVIFLIYRSNSKSGTAMGKPGTVALDQSAPVQTGETMPLDPMGTLPLDPGFVAAPVAAQWQLRAVDGSFNGQTFPLTGTLRLGRAPQCQIVFPDGTPGISSNHCEVAIENGAVVLRDLGSSYGTFGKGGKLAPHTPCYLTPGDTFTLAQSQTFQLESAGAVQTGGAITVRDTQGREYRTGSGRMAFGRAAGNKVQFPADDKAVSSNHCVLYREGGKLYLMDVGSTNGTFFNESNRLKPNTPYRIRKGMAFFLTNRKNTFVVVED